MTAPLPDFGREVYRTIEAFGWSVTWRSDRFVPDDAWPIDIINRAIADAERRGRESAADALRRYGEHHEHCLSYAGVHPESECNCGFTAALSASEAKP